MSAKGAPQQPARKSWRGAEWETVDFANRRNKRRRLRDLAKASRKKNRR